MLLALLSLYEIGAVQPQPPLIITPPVVVPVTETDTIAARIRTILPARWWSSPAPIRDAIIGGISDMLAWSFSLIGYAKNQIRLATAQGLFLDIFSYDYLGLEIKRGFGETDALFRPRVQKEILRERVTRSGMVSALTDLTGQAPIIVEPWNPGDTGAWENGTFSWGGGGVAGSGGWGSTSLPNQVFITAFRAGFEGVPGVMGWSGRGSPGGGWESGLLSWISTEEIQGAVTDLDIYETINATKPVGVTTWVRLEG